VTNIPEVLLHFFVFLPRSAPKALPALRVERRNGVCAATPTESHWLRAALCSHPFIHTTHLTLKARQAAKSPYGFAD